ncbi:hypothetical protein HanPI659440_Chr13g0497741 [Helianthus annuus]|nr:hypothetical protein HanPI659440_Chr13g0497741 [Helianthus annuus]
MFEDLKHTTSLQHKATQVIKWKAKQERIVDLKGISKIRSYDVTLSLLLEINFDVIK